MRPQPPPLLVVCDIDGTMTGDVAALEEFKRVWRTVLAPAGAHAG